MRLPNGQEVETLFHEFGHALQHMLTEQADGLVSGIRGIEWDAVELPSQFMENWCAASPQPGLSTGATGEGALHSYRASRWCACLATRPHALGASLKSFWEYACVHPGGYISLM